MQHLASAAVVSTLVIEVGADLALPLVLVLAKLTLALVLVFIMSLSLSCPCRVLVGNLVQDSSH